VGGDIAVPALFRLSFAALDPGPILDLRVRWRAGRVALGLAALLTVVAAFRPLAHEGSPRLFASVALALGAGAIGSALLAGLRGRGLAEQLALYAFVLLGLDGLGQILGPLGWPIWPAMALVVAFVAVAEAPAIAFGAAAMATLLGVLDAAASGFTHWKAVVAASIGYAALAFFIQLAQRMEKKRLSAAMADLARLRHGIDELEDASHGGPPRLGPAGLALKDVSEDARRARRLDRAAELDEAVARVVAIARRSLGAHAAVYFNFDREAEKAFLRAADGPGALVHETIAPLRSDPFAFVLDRGQPFYATDFKRLLWRLPWYRGEVKVGTLVAAPVRLSEVVRGALVVDRLEIQSFTGPEPELIAMFADLIAETIRASAASDVREEIGTEFKAVYEVSRQMAGLDDPVQVRQRLLGCARDLLAPEGGAVVTINPAGTGYSVDNSLGWVQEFEGRRVALLEDTWTAWLLKQDDPGLLLDDVHGGARRRPILVLDEGSSRAESLLAVALRSSNEVLGAIVLTGRRGAFDSTGQRVLTILANQAAGALRVKQLIQQAKDTAMRDGLTGLYNRRAFDEHLAEAIAREDRQQGRFALVLLDIDHFKKLNDTFGHPAGDATLRHTSKVIAAHLRGSDQAARFGGEEFALILPATEEPGAVQLAERVRAAVEKSPLVHEGARLGVTVSLGVAIWPRHGPGKGDIVAAADRALYAAKQGGRNRVEVAAG
jgi:diguanylate cyclase (GGDEF)-like protein